MAIWTSIEPSVGVLCSCLPTLRPVLREVWFKGGQLWTIVRSTTSPTRKGDTIYLEFGDRRTQKLSLSHHARWINNNLSKSVGGPDSERDDILLKRTNVQNDVRIEHAPL